MFDIPWLTVAGETFTINPIIYLLWMIWVGWIFSSVGAFGGIMAGVGHISIMGLGKWADAMKGKNVEIGGYTDAGNYITDNIRFSSTLITFVNSLSSTINWQTQKRLVWPAGIALGIGGVLGAQVAVFGTGGKLGVDLYKGIFGVCTWAVSFYMFYQLTPQVKSKKSAGQEAARRFKERVDELKEQGRLDELEGVENLKLKKDAAEFEFFDEQFKVKHYVPFIWGFIVGFIAVLIGVGGGFLLVPFLTAIGLPMYIAPGVSVLGVIFSQASGLIAWAAVKQMFALPVIIGWVGILIGSYIGPRTQKYIKIDYLYAIFGILAFYVGLRYILSGFLGIQLPP